MPDKRWHDLDAICLGMASDQPLNAVQEQQAHWLEMSPWNDVQLLVSMTLYDEHQNSISFHASRARAVEIRDYLTYLIQENERDDHQFEHL